MVAARKLTILREMRVAADALICKMAAATNPRENCRRRTIKSWLVKFPTRSHRDTKVMSQVRKT